MKVHGPTSQAARRYDPGTGGGKISLHAARYLSWSVSRWYDPKVFLQVPLGGGGEEGGSCLMCPIVIFEPHTERLLLLVVTARNKGKRSLWAISPAAKGGTWG